MQERSRNDVCRDLSKLLKVSQRACNTFLDAVTNVTSGIRQAYLVDCFCIPSELLHPVYTLLFPAERLISNICLLHETVTEQTFVINRTLLNQRSLPPPLFVNAVEKCTQADEPPYIDTILRQLNSATDKHVIYLNLKDGPAEISAQQARRRMITITGFLLEYPFVYVISDTASDRQVETCLNDVPLLVVSLNTSGSAKANHLVKCSIPEEVAKAQPGLDDRLERYRRSFDARMSQDSVAEWSLEYVKLDRVVL